MPDDSILIYHNPDCGTSRNALAIIRASGCDPRVVEYLKAGWSRPQLEELLAAMAMRPRDLMRISGTPAEKLGLTRPEVTDAEILDAMLAEPILVNRPIVQTPKGVKLCRPSEVVASLLDHVPSTYTKEDGETVRLSIGDTQ